jgi:hypothetical protein
MQRNITLQVHWVPSEKFLADSISRWERDRGDYTLDPLRFHYILKEFFKDFVNLKTDLFTPPGNKILDQFVSRWAHRVAVEVDTLQCPLDNLGDLYAYPPWSVIDKFLTRLKIFPKCQNFDGALLLGFSHMVVPINKNESSKKPWPQGQPLQGHVQNLLGGRNPPKKCWGDLLCIICSGKFWRGRQIQNSTIEDFIGKQTSLKRYEISFHLL